MKYTHIIWDFNGTMLDDVRVCIDAVNVLLRARNLPTLDSEEAYREVSGFPVIDYYKRIGFDFSKEPYDKVALEWVEQYTEHVHEASLYSDVLAVLSYFREQGMKQILLSASEIKMLKGQVASLGIGEFFDQICGMDNVYAHGKISLAKTWRRENPEAVALFVGDTDHDMEVAKVIDADCVLFSGGHQSRRRLEETGYPVVDRLTELESLLRGK